MQLRMQLSPCVAASLGNCQPGHTGSRGHARARLHMAVKRTPSPSCVLPCASGFRCTSLGWMDACRHEPMGHTALMRLHAPPCASMRGHTCDSMRGHTWMPTHPYRASMRGHTCDSMRGHTWMPTHPYRTSPAPHVCARPPSVKCPMPYDDPHWGLLLLRNRLLACQHLPAAMATRIVQAVSPPGDGPAHSTAAAAATGPAQAAGRPCSSSSRSSEDGGGHAPPVGPGPF